MKKLMTRWGIVSVASVILALFIFSYEPVDSILQALQTQINTITSGAALIYTRTAGHAPILIVPKVYGVKFTTNGSGVIVDTLTTDGTFTGTALFSHIYSVQLSGKYGGSVVNIPVQGYTIAANSKSITINVGTGTILGLLGATILTAGSGVEVSIFIMGD